MRTQALIASALSATALLAPPALAADQALITDLCDTIRANYVFPDVAERTADHIQARADAGAYDDLSTRDLAGALTRDLQAYTSDRHFSARQAPQRRMRPPQDSDIEQQPADPRDSAPHGVHTLERLAANIAYLDLRGFHAEPLAHDSIIAAVQLMQGAPALIFDLRRNGGGDPATVQLLCSYLFDPAEPVHLNSLYFRPADETTEFWTNAEHPELAMPDTPVYVLTSSYTFSGAEEFTYNLQTRDRATVIGETTGGGAHPVSGFPIGDELVVMIPVGRAINPITETNWEGTGVTPDIAVPADQALDMALEHALAKLFAAGDRNAAWGLYQLAARNRSHTVPRDQLAQYAGNYTDREIKLDDDSLMYRRVGAGTWTPLIPVGEDTFMIDGNDDFRMEFERNPDASIAAIRGIYQAGHTDRSARAD